MALEAVIFDMDGTIIDSMPYHKTAWHLFLSKKGLDVSDEELMKRGHGTLFDIMPRFFGSHISRDDSYRLAMEKEQIFRDLYGPFMTLIPGARDFFEAIKFRQMLIGLGTAADFTNTDFTLDTLSIRPFFDTIVTSDLVPKGKPSPDVYLYAADKMEVNPHHCFVFEDTFSGAEAAKAAGMKVGVITTMHSKEEWEGMNVDFISSDFTKVDIDQIIRIFN